MLITYKQFIYTALFSAYVAFPRLLFAAPTTFADLVNSLVGILSALVPVLIGLGLLYFLWGLATFLLNTGSEQAAQAGRERMMYGIIGLVVMVSIWGLVAVVRGSIGI